MNAQRKAVVVPFFPSESSPLFAKHQNEWFALRTQAPVPGMQCPDEIAHWVRFTVGKVLAECTPELSMLDAKVIGSLIVGRLLRSWPIEDRRNYIQHCLTIIEQEGGQ